MSESAPDPRVRENEPRRESRAGRDFERGVTQGIGQFFGCLIAIIGFPAMLYLAHSCANGRAPAPAPPPPPKTISQVIRESGNEIAKAIDTKMDLYRLAAPMRNAVHSGESEIAEPVEMGGIKIGDSLESFKKRFGQPSKTGQAEAVLVGQDWPGAAFASYSFSEVVVIVGSDGMIKHYYVGTKAE